MFQVVAAAPTRALEQRSRRRRAFVLLAVALLLVFGIILSQTSFDLRFLTPDSNQQLLFFATLSALVFLLFVFLFFILARNLLKVFAERRMGDLGSKFRTRLVVFSLLLSILPVMVMFWFAYGLMNHSIDKWFSSPVEQVRADTAEMTLMLSEYAAQNARAEAQAIAESPDTQRAFAGHGFNSAVTEFRRREATLQDGFVFALQNGNAEASFRAPAPWPVLKPVLPLQQALRDQAANFSWAGTEYVLAGASVSDRGSILVAMPLPLKFSETVKEVEASQTRYWELSKQRRLVRRTYMSLLMLLTVVVLFATTWLALFLSKLVTRPVAALAEATQEISRGRFDYRVDVRGADEIGDLVRSFNRMAEELESSRRQLDNSTQELAEDNGARAAIAGADLRNIFPAELIEDFAHLFRRADRMGVSGSQMEISASGGKLNFAVTVATLEHGRQRQGYVLVFEDLSDVLRAQRQTAWREVARRVAHEIKNPLTPIALSAER